MVTAAEVRALLKLQPLEPEGGYYVETYRSEGTIPAASLAGRYRGARAYGTAIYYLLTPGTVSALHRLPGDEIWHFYLGDPAEMLQLGPAGAGRLIVLGQDIARGMQLQVVVPGGVWQGTRLLPGGRFALLGTTMAPGFDPGDYEEGRAEELLAGYSHFREAIQARLRQPPGG